MPFEPIDSIPAERLTLRPAAERDLPDLLEINGDPEVTRFLPYATWQSLDDGAAWLRRMETLGSTGTGQQLVAAMRQRWVAKGVVYDTNFYGYLAEDWQARGPR
jgi:RimJ/RimL family protein N-acetyltransferase